MAQFEMMESYITKIGAVYNYLRNNILKKDFGPGEKIIIREIAKRLNGRHIPVREAIMKLDIPGLLDVIRHIGATGAEINKSEMEEIYIVRSTLKEVL